MTFRLTPSTSAVSRAGLRALKARCRESGCVIGPGPLTLAEAEAKEGLEILCHAVEAAR